MGGVYVISHAVLPDWSVNQGELSRIPAENVNFQITVMNMQQQKPTQPEHSMKVLQQESRSWPNMMHSSYFFLHEITGAEWDKYWLKFWNYDSDQDGFQIMTHLFLGSVSLIHQFRMSGSNETSDRDKNPSSTLRVCFDLVPYVGTLVEGRRSALTLPSLQQHNSSIIGIWDAFPSPGGCAEVHLHSAWDHLYTRAPPHTQPQKHQMKWTLFLKSTKKLWSYAGKQWACIPEPLAVTSVWPVQPRLELSPACSCSRWIHPEVKLFRTTEADREYVWRAPSVKLCGLDGFELSSEGWCLRHYSHIVCSL